jgi:phosphoribosylanthranilate isomerase
MTPIVKICGLSTQATLDAALDAGADMVGFVFFPKSPRHIDWATARTLGRQAEGRAKIVALSVDANDDTLRRIVDALSPDLMQLHGSETPARVKEIGELFARPTMKAIGVATRADLAGAKAYEGVADLLLIDAKPPKGAALPGGNGRPFDWDLTRDFRSSIPWLLSGGLDPDSVAAAIELSGAGGVDVSSGVESAPGVKDPARIRSFVAAARRAFAREEIAFADAVHSPSADGRPSGRPLDRVSALRSPSKDGRSSERPFGRGYNPRQPEPEQRK